MIHDPNEPRLFPTLPPELIDKMRDFGTVCSFSDGDEVLAEGTADYPFYIVLEGRVRMTKKIGAETQVIAVHDPGQFIGEMSMLTGAPAAASGYAVGPTKLLCAPVKALRSLPASEDIRKVIIGAISRRTEELSGFVVQQEKLAALGKLSAGLAHELNNPAAAARRASANLKETIGDLQDQALRYDLRFTDQERAAALEWQHRLAHNGASSLDSLERSDREEAVCSWLDSRQIERSWELAPTFVSAGLTTAGLDQLASALRPEALSAAVTWIESSLQVNELTSQLENSLSRISDLVSAMKDYSYMDRAALQDVDIHRGIESTLKIFGHALKDIEVVRSYDHEIPPICAYAGELNQVWTNLIANALDAMAGHGRLTIKTQRDEDHVTVEIGDTGPGVPAEIQSRIFEPFFTTKPLGKGTGLGLDISYRIVVGRHHGNIRVLSKPGDTRFQVRLPMRQPKEEQ